VSGHRLAVATIIAATTLGCAGHRPRTPPAPAHLTTRDIVARAKPAIVRIESVPDRVGTGFAIEASGVIATNLHVVAGAREIHVQTLDGTTYDVQHVRAFDLDRDLALLDITPKQPMPVLALGDSDRVSAGDRVIAIGNPMGVLDYSVSDGLISSVRVLSPTLTVLQISAPISEGSSGGPLFDSTGRVIGVATAILTSGQNLNFAVPTNYLKSMLASRAQISLDEFARQTSPPPREVRAGGDVRITRRVPVHDVSILDGCSEADMEQIFQGISHAIESGAPLYNAGNHEACYRIYEGTAIKFERDAPCPGVRSAFGDGLLRASTLTSFTEKAWAMRDTFDGLIDVMERRARAQGGGAGSGSGATMPTPTPTP
jgi:serine protease Do